jgi:3-oxoacyl-(acyl-carrier-protein) synthase
MKRTLAVLSLVFVLAIAANSQSTNPQQPAKLGKKQMAALVANAKTPADHARLASYYTAQAQNDMDEAQFHEQMAGNFHDSAVASSDKFATGTIKHCLYIHDRLKVEAAKMRALAQRQEQMASSGL